VTAYGDSLGHLSQGRVAKLGVEFGLPDDHDL
jgi:hypothetical protein